jgi:predicted alpha/beta-fold hydrolase
MGRYSDTTPLPDLYRPTIGAEMPQMEQATQALVIALAGIEGQLTRIADALETQVAAQEASAAFAKVLMDGRGMSDFVTEGPNLAPDGLPRKPR